MAKPDAKALANKALKVKVTSTNAEERTITAVVSSSNYDRDYERVDVPSLRLPLKGGGHVKASELTGTERIDIPMLLNHSFDVEDVIGSVRKAYLNEMNELVVDFGISSRAKAQDLMILIDEEHLDNAFSITMSDYQYDYESEVISDAEVVEISLVFRGSNKDARVLAVKSLLNKESEMTQVKEQSLAEKKAALELLSKEIADAEKATTVETVEPVVEVVADAPAEEEAVVVEEAATAPVETPVVETPAPAPTEVVEAAAVVEEEEEEEQTNQPEKETEMTEIAKKSVVKAAPTEVEQPVATKTASKREVRELYVKQIKAFLGKDRETLATLNAKAMELSGAKSKAINFADGTAVYQSEIVSADIREAYSNVGRVGSLVNHVNITGAEKWSQLNEANGVGFRPVGAEEEKQEDKPVWTKMSIEPKEHAVIVAWFDGMAKRTPLAVYNQIVKYIAKQYVNLEDKIILSFDGATTAGGDVFERTGLIPTLRATASVPATSRVIDAPDFSAAAVQAALGAAYGLIESDEVITLTANRKTWAQLATAVDTAGRNVFTIVGDQISAGALGTFNVALSQEAGEGEVVVGAYGDYTLVTLGGLETLFSREATVGDLNLYVSDASALRANIDIAGKAVALKSFALIDFATV